MTDKCNDCEYENLRIIDYPCNKCKDNCEYKEKEDKHKDDK